MDRSAAPLPSAQGRWIVLLWLIALFAVLAVWRSHVGDLASYRTAPPGQLAYVLAKVSGLVAALTLAAQALATLLQRLTGHRALVCWRGAHYALGCLAFALLWGHALAFMSAVAQRTQHWPWELLWPRFSADGYGNALALGALGLGVLTVAVLGGALRLAGQRLALWGHRLAPLGLLLGLWHGLSIGSEARTPWLSAIYLLAAVLVVLLLVGRWWQLAARQRAAQLHTLEAASE